MSRLLLAILILTLYARFANAQKKTLDNPPTPPSKLEKFLGANNDNLVSGVAYGKIVSDKFSYLVTGDKSMSSLGNYISINVLKPSATAAFGGVVHGSKSTTGIVGVVTGSVTGGVDQEFVSLFTDNELNSSFEGRINYSLSSSLFGSKFYYEGDEKERLNALRKSIGDYFEYRKLLYEDRKIVYQAAESDYGIEHDKPLPPDAALRRKTILTLAKQRFKLDSIQARLTEEGKRFNADKIEATKTDSITNMEVNAKWSSIKLGWIDFFASGKQQKVNLLDTSVPTFYNKVKENNSAYFKLGAAYNLSWSSEKYGRFYNGIIRFEVSYSRDNNASDLDGIDVTSSQKFDSLNSTKTASRKVTAYDSKLFKTHRYVDYKIDILKQLSPNHRAYLRVIYNPSVQLKRGQETAAEAPTTHNLTLGILLAFNAKDKPKSLVNVQPYIKFKDLTNEYNLDSRILRRSEIGLVTAFPLGLPTPKKK